MDDDIRPLLAELEAAIRRSRADGRIDEGEAEELRALIGRVERALAERAGHDGIVDRLEATAVRFEGDHPRLAATLRSVVDTLTAAGI